MANDIKVLEDMLKEIQKDKKKEEEKKETE